METKEMRAVYTETLIDLGKSDPNIVVLEADLMRATGTGTFGAAYPDRIFNVGVAEANMVGVAGGLSSVGKIPFAATFACFASRRAYDQFFISANYARLNVKLVGTDPGITAAFNGGTHMPFEDLGLMRIIPDLVIFEPSDPVSLAALLRESAKHRGCTYMRLQRKPAAVLYPEGEKFEFGRAKVLKEGGDVTILALGAIMVPEALKAAEELAKEGINAAVIDVLTLKPIDRDLVATRAEKSGALVTAENHQIIGGLGSAVAEIIAEGAPAVLRRVGVKGEFGEVGTQDYLAERFGLTAAAIAASAREAYKVKRRKS
jgi:transketolase